MAEMQEVNLSAKEFFEIVHNFTVFDLLELRLRYESSCKLIL